MPRLPRGADGHLDDGALGHVRHDQLRNVDGALAAAAHLDYRRVVAPEVRVGADDLDFEDATLEALVLKLDLYGYSRSGVSFRWVVPVRVTLTLLLSKYSEVHISI